MGPGGPSFGGATIGKRPARVVIGATLAVIVTVAACHRTPQESPAPIPNPTPVVIVEPTDDGNGVYYFPVTGEQYRRSLAAFYEQKPFLHCDLQGFTEQTTQDPYVTYSRFKTTTGFILHCHDIAVEAQEVTKE